MKNKHNFRPLLFWQQKETIFGFRRSSRRWECEQRFTTMPLNLPKKNHAVKWFDRSLILLLTLSARQHTIEIAATTLERPTADWSLIETHCWALYVIFTLSLLLSLMLSLDLWQTQATDTISGHNQNNQFSAGKHRKAIFPLEICRWKAPKWTSFNLTGWGFQSQFTSIGT